MNFSEDLDGGCNSGGQIINANTAMFFHYSRSERNTAHFSQGDKKVL